jgi:hypothetical protein
MENMKNMELEDVEYLIIGIRMQLDECDNNRSHYDPNIVKYFDEKRKILHKLWQKLEQNPITFE